MFLLAKRLLQQTCLNKDLKMPVFHFWGCYFNDSEEVYPMVQIPLSSKLAGMQSLFDGADYCRKPGYEDYQNRTLKYIF